MFYLRQQNTAYVVGRSPHWMPLTARVSSCTQRHATPASTHPVGTSGAHRYSCLGQHMLCVTSAYLTSAAARTCVACTRSSASQCSPWLDYRPSPGWHFRNIQSNCHQRSQIMYTGHHGTLLTVQDINLKAYTINNHDKQIIRPHRKLNAGHVNVNVK